MQTNKTKRIYIVAGAFLLMGVCIITRLFYVQIVHHSAYTDKADRQFASPSQNVFDRGSIFFTTKDGERVTAATMQLGYKLAVTPRLVTDPEMVYTKINEVVPIDREDFDKKIAKTTDPYEEIVNRLTEDQANTLRNLDLPGVALYKEKWRFYPGGSIASQTLGFVGFDNNDKLVGRAGLESSYNNVLSRKADEVNVNFFAEVFGDINDTVFKNTQDEGDLVLTIEPSVQAELEKTMTTVREKWNGEIAGGIVMDPRDGSIIAMAGDPMFNPNEYGKVKDPSVFLNPDTERVYEIGSVIKPLVMAAAIDKGVLTPETTYADYTGSLTISGKTINNFDKKGRGVASMQTVLDQSLNTGMVFVENKLGHENFRNYMLSFGLGEKTNVGLPGELSGLVSNLKAKDEVAYATASFGQGIAVTPIEAVRAWGALANGGYMVQPHVVAGIDKEITGYTPIAYPLGKQVLKTETTKTIGTMLTHVFDVAYGGGKIKYEHYSVAAKTGTAQIAMPNGQGYYADKHMHSFFSYFPVSNPRFVTYFFIRDPQGAQYASQTLIPPFLEFSKYLIHYYEIPPDR